LWLCSSKHCHSIQRKSWCMEKKTKALKKINKTEEWFYLTVVNPNPVVESVFILYTYMIILYLLIDSHHFELLKWSIEIFWFKKYTVPGPRYYLATSSPYWRGWFY
jgi:hypothetical protein